MKKRSIDRERTVVANDQAAKIAEPSKGTLHCPASSVATQDAAVLGRRAMTVRTMRCDQQDASFSQPRSQRIPVIPFVGDHPQRFLSRPPRMMSPPYVDRRQRRLREPDFRRGRRTKVVPQRNSAAVESPRVGRPSLDSAGRRSLAGSAGEISAPFDHHHPLRPLAPLGFPDFGAPFLAGAV
jgi:hypothetical protein